MKRFNSMEGRLKLWKRTVLGILVGSILSLSAQAASILVVNPSFEDPILPDDSQLTARPIYCGSNPAPYGCISFSSGWTNPYPDGDSAGTYNPSSASFPAIPDGQNVAYSNGGFFYQTVSAVLQPGVTYTLDAFAGERKYLEGVDGFSENQGYFMELALADPGGDFALRTTLARGVFNSSVCCFNIYSVNSPDYTRPGYGNWIGISLSYTALQADPARNLMIVFGSPAVQANFDMVTFSDDTVTAVPEPSSLALAGLALAAFAVRKKFKAA